MQDVVAILIAAIAAAFLLWRGCKSLAARRCGNCSQCNAAGGTNPTNLVTISSLVAHDRPPTEAG